MAQKIETLDTPSLLLDIAASQRNIDRMANMFKGTSATLRPHFKNHKCPQLARRQIAAGATGMTCAKLAEAEILAARGFDDLLVANQVVGADKIRRLSEVARKAKIAVAVDDASNVEMLAAGAAEAGIQIGVLVEIDNGNGRCGVRELHEAVALGRKIASSRGLRLEGIQAYEGQATYIDDIEQRKKMLIEAVARTAEFRSAMQKDGLNVAKIGGGSTSTSRMLAEHGGVDEVQAGTYPTMDWRYHELIPEFENALSILSRVISIAGGLTILDIGSKGMGLEFGPPKLRAHPQMQVKANEEHAIVTGHVPGARVGDVLEVLPSHACTTCNLHREFIVHENGAVVDRWAIEASGQMK